MSDQFSRTELLIGKDGIERLKKARVAVFGIGGVGGYTVEALARSGIGILDLIDDDKVCLSNLNRQIIATRKTVGRYKTEVMRERILDINPDATVNIYQTFYSPETADQFDFSKYDYVVDAIDTVTGKLELVEQAEQSSTRIISSMGAGNKMDATAFEVADIYQTSVCPLARVMRRELKKRGIKKLKVVYSKEQPIQPLQPINPGDHRDIHDKASETDEILSPELSELQRNGSSRRQIPGSTAFVPAVAGLIIAGEVVKDLAMAGIE